MEGRLNLETIEKASDVLEKKQKRGFI